MIRRYAAEVIGTFTIVFAPVAFSATAPRPNLLEAALVSGLAVLAMVYALGPISAAHFNPAVSLGFAVARRFPWRYVAPYWLSQLAGAILAAALSSALFGPGYGVHIPHNASTPLLNVALEAILTFFLMFVIIAVATDKRVSSAVPAIAIGFTVVFGVLIGGPVTGGSMNPARSLGPALFSSAALANYWIYALGPCLGAVVGALLYEAVRIEHAEAKGAPNELLIALEEMATKTAS